MEKYSDIIFDHLSESSKFKENGESLVLNGKYKFKKETFNISNKKLSQRFHKPIGKYTLLTFPHILSCNDDQYRYYLKQMTTTLKEYLTPLRQEYTILVIGIGNRHISSDSLGVEVVKNVVVTRNISEKRPKVCAFTPSVLGLTGIETADTIDGISAKIRPNIIIMIDSLCASDVNRLGVSFQVNNTPIIPGSGINNTRKKISSNIKTISIGVPLVVYANTFIKSAINGLKIDIDSINDNKLKSKLYQLFNNQFNELVTLNEIEYAVKQIGLFIATAINNALGL